MLKLFTWMTFLVLYSCSSFSPFRSSQSQKSQSANASHNKSVQRKAEDNKALSQATRLTKDWPESSFLAAKEIISKYGSPHEKTQNMLIWENVSPFKKIIVHKEVYKHRFPFLHQNALEHVVEYKVPHSKVGDIWNYNGSIVLDRTKGEMSSFAETEAMNFLALNLAHEIVQNKLNSQQARLVFGQETINFTNGKMSAYTSVLSFGNQFQTADEGSTIAQKIIWQKPKTRRKFKPLRQAQEEK